MIELVFHRNREATITQHRTNFGLAKSLTGHSLRASPPIWASEASREGPATRSRVLVRLASLVQIRELARKLDRTIRSHGTVQYFLTIHTEL